MKLGLLLLLALLAGCMRAQVAFDRVLHAGREPQNWLTYSGNYTGSRYSSLVFGDGQGGDFVALDANTRKPLWSAYLGCANASGPMTYSVNGKQYIIGTAPEPCTRSLYRSST